MGGRCDLSDNLRGYGLRKKTLAVERGLSIVLAGLCAAIVEVTDPGRQRRYHFLDTA